MGIGFSLFLIALGAILAWAVNGTVTGLDIHVVGAIFMVVGVVGLLLSLMFWSSVAPFAGRAPFARRQAGSVAPAPSTVVVHHTAPPRTVIVHEQAPRTVLVRAPAPDTVVVREHNATAEEAPPTEYVERY